MGSLGGEQLGFSQACELTRAVPQSCSLVGSDQPHHPIQLGCCPTAAEQHGAVAHCPRGSQAPSWAVLTRRAVAFSAFQ